MDRRELVAALAGAAVLPRISTLGAPPPDLAFVSATEALAALRARRISAVELVKLQLDRIERLNPRINAIVNPLRESALARAREIDARRKGAAPAGALAGLPVTIKDTFEIAGVRTTAGFEPLKNHVPQEDAAAVARLREAGAIFLGNTNTPPLASDWQTNNPIYGRTNNPWDVERTPGGSSGGSSAAIAAGLGYLSVGSDIGGSIRIPSCWTGIYGHKPTVDLVPLRGHIPPPPGVMGPSPTLPVAGPMARTADDLLLGLRTLGGPDRDEAIAYRWTLPPARRTRLRDFRVGYVLDHPACPLTPEVARVVRSAIDALRRAGVSMKEGWPEGVDPVAQFNTYQYLVSVAAFGPNLDETKIEEVRQRASASGNAFDVVIAKAQTDPWKRIMEREHERMVARGTWQRWFQNQDVFLLPVVFTPAIPHDPEQKPIATSAGPRPYLDLLWWIAFGTLTGCPVTAAPIGFTNEGLPVGIQIIGPYLEDATPITFAARLADVTGGFKPPAGYW